MQAGTEVKETHSWTHSQGSQPLIAAKRTD